MLTFYLASVDLRYLVYQDKLKSHHRMNMSVSPIHPFKHTHASRKPATCPLRDSSPPPVPFQLIVGCTLVCLLLDSMKSGFSLYMSSCSSFFSAGDGVEEFERLSEVCEGYECLRTACSVAHRWLGGRDSWLPKISLWLVVSSLSFVHCVGHVSCSEVKPRPEENP